MRPGPLRTNALLASMLTKLPGGVTVGGMNVDVGAVDSGVGVRLSSSITGKSRMVVAQTARSRRIQPKPRLYRIITQVASSFRLTGNNRSPASNAPTGRKSTPGPPRTKTSSPMTKLPSSGASGVSSGSDCAKITVTASISTIRMIATCHCRDTVPPLCDA